MGIRTRYFNSLICSVFYLLSQGKTNEFAKKLKPRMNTNKHYSFTTKGTKDHEVKRPTMIITSFVGLRVTTSLLVVFYESFL
jgi:hypothetical protein